MRRGALRIIFVASGMAGLVFEVALQRSLVRWFGVSAWASALVLAAYMAGLALGALLFGRLADRSKNALKLYGLLELGVAGWALASPWLINRAGELFVSLALDQPLDAPGPKALRFFFALLLTLAPTVLMGGTLPAMARALAQHGEKRESVAQLYSLNLAGAALGAFGASYALLPTLGLTKAFAFGAGLNLLAGLASLLFPPAARAGGAALEAAPSEAQRGARDGASSAHSQREQSSLPDRLAAAPPRALEAAPETLNTRVPRLAAAENGRTADEITAPPHAGTSRALLALAAWSGFAVFVAEVTWTHLLATVIGCSAYAFGLMLGVLLLALAAGGGWLSRLPDAQVNWPRVGAVSLTAGLTLTLTLPLWDQAPEIFVITGGAVTSFEGRELVRALVALEVVGVPAAVLGVIYPLVLRMAARREDLGTSLGGVAAANTAGAVVGSLLTGFVLLPALGSRGILTLLIVGTCGLALVLLRGWKRWAGVGVVALAAIFPAWNLARLASGTNVYFHDAGYSTGLVEWSSESITGGFTSVVKNAEDGTRVMLTNGKFQGSNRGEITAQRAFAQIPALQVREGQRALLVGIGTGGALQALASQPFAQVDAVELVEDVTTAARRYFHEVNGGVLDNPRVKVIHADGRNLLLLSSQQYDTVSMQLSSVWFAGAADLYNREYYQLVRSRLRPGGVFQQWLQLHHVTAKNLAVMLRTLSDVFPHVTLFVRGGQGIALGSDAPFEFDYPALAAFSQKYRTTEAVAGLPANELSSLVNSLVLDEDGLARFVADQHADVSTDDNLQLEYATPRGNVLVDASTDAMLEALRPYAPKKIRWKNAPAWVDEEMRALAAIDQGFPDIAREALAAARAKGATLAHFDAAISTP